MSKSKKEERLGLIKMNNWGYPMKIVEYNGANDIIVEFQDEYKLKAKCTWQRFQRGNIINPYIYENRLGEEKHNNQGCLMKIVEYNNAMDIIVEFQDKYKGRIHTQYNNFLLGNTKNPYYPTVFGVGTIGTKCKIGINGGKGVKEYNAWCHMLERCFDEKLKEKFPTYQDVTCCDEWLLFDNFYEWLCSQENFNKWKNDKRWHLDKDILIKGNKMYSPETCCLVPQNVNILFIKGNALRGELPIGVYKHQNKFQASCNNPFINKRISLGLYDTPEEAFLAYKIYKEDIIKQMAQQEFDNGNITEKCYNAMMKYEVEITD